MATFFPPVNMLDFLLRYTEASAPADPLMFNTAAMLFYRVHQQKRKLLCAREVGPQVVADALVLSALCVELSYRWHDDDAPDCFGWKEAFNCRSAILECSPPKYRLHILKWPIKKVKQRFQTLFLQDLGGEIPLWNYYQVLGNVVGEKQEAPYTRQRIISMLALQIENSLLRLRGHCKCPVACVRAALARTLADDNGISALVFAPNWERSIHYACVCGQCPAGPACKI
jgi:hypothetical protein